MAEVSYDRIREMIRAALLKKYPPADGDPWGIYVREVFQTYAVVEKDGQLLKFDYTIAEGTAELGEPKPVEATYVKAYERGPAVLLDKLPTPLLAEGKELYDIPLMPAGKWQRFTIEAKHLDEMVKNFAASENGMLPIDYEHSMELLGEEPGLAQGGPIPAAGWIHKIRKADLGSVKASLKQALVATVEFTKKALEMIRAGEYRFISPAWAFESKDRKTGEPRGARLVSAGLTNKPFFTELPPLKASEISVAPVSDRRDSPVEGAEHDSKAQGTEGAKQMLKPKKIEAGEHAGKFACYEGDTLVGMMEEADLLARESKPFTDESFAAYLTDVGIPKEAQTPDRLKGMLVAGEEAQKRAHKETSRQLLLTEVIVNGKVDATVAANYLAEGKITAEDFKAGIAAERRVDGAIQAGKLLPRQRGEGIRLALMETETFKPFKTLIEDGKPLVNLNPKGLSSGGTGDATTDLRNLAKARAAEKNIPLSQALTEIGRENPQLAREHRERVMGGQ